MNYARNGKRHLIYRSIIQQTSICRHSNIKPKDLWNGDELSLKGKNTLWHYGLNGYDSMSYGTINRLEHATYIFRADQPQMWDSKLLLYAATTYSTTRHQDSELGDASSAETLVLSQQPVILTHAAMPQERVHQYDLSALVIISSAHRSTQQLRAKHFTADQRYE